MAVNCVRKGRRINSRLHFRCPPARTQSFGGGTVCFEMVGAGDRLRTLKTPAFKNERPRGRSGLPAMRLRQRPVCVSGAVVVRSALSLPVPGFGSVPVLATSGCAGTAFEGLCGGGCSRGARRAGRRERAGSYSSRAGSSSQTRASKGRAGVSSVPVSSEARGSLRSDHQRF